jgi:hypothetical protein
MTLSKLVVLCRSTGLILFRPNLVALGLLLGLLIVALVVGGCSQPAPELETDGLSANEVYARLEQAMTRPGKVFHTVVRISQEAGPLSYEGRLELWAVPQQGRAHQVVEFTFGGGDTWWQEEVLAGGIIYGSPYRGRSPSKYEALKCPEASALVSTAIPCPRFDQTGATSVETVQYKGVAAVALTTDVVWSGSDEIIHATRRLYLDAQSFLPIALQYDGTVDYGEVSTLRGQWTYENGFLPLDSLPDDFFDPASVGYVEPDPKPTPTPNPSPRDGSSTCSGQEELPPCGPGVEMGKPYPYTLYTHCGIRSAYFDGRRWVAAPSDSTP